MSFNADIGRRVTTHINHAKWVATRSKGVELLRFEHINEVKDVATSLMRFAPGSYCPTHVHGGGEEYLVLEGTFQDEAGDYPTGSYVRQPPGSRHTPRTDEGCLLFMKTWQFAPRDRRHVNIDAFAQAIYTTRMRPGVEMQSLFSDSREDVRIEHWAPNQLIELVPCNGLELIVLTGDYTEIGVAHKRYSWSRLPPGCPLKARAGEFGTRVLVKEGHLVHAVPGRIAYIVPEF